MKTLTGLAAIGSGAVVWLKVIGIGLAVVVGFMVVDLIIKILYWGIIAAVLVGAVFVALKLRQLYLNAQEHRTVKHREATPKLAPRQAPMTTATPVSPPWLRPATPSPAPAPAADVSDELRELKREMGIE